MDKIQKTYFEALTAKRIKSAEALDDFALRGVKESVVEKYSDQAHFVYELLQNADDAKATSTRFILLKDKLVFAHNGTRRFFTSNPETETQDHENGTLGDINAITAVGGSNKKDEATIGKFGIGFKAVFQYTATPVIYDPDIFFKIERLIVPTLIADDFTGRKKDETFFVFPFNHGKRSAEDSYADISDKLRSLDYPLLFLANLKDISFEISNVMGIYEKTVEKSQVFGDTTAELVKLTQNNGENRNEFYDDILWLFSRSDGKGHTYSTGFFINGEGHLIPKKHTAFCFFPTKEGTGLNYIVHAPFLLTDSREGIRAGVQHNTDMISLLSRLAADSLVYLKEIGQSKVPLIDDNIFDIVPYDESGFTEVNSKKTISFKPFYTAIKEAFKSETIIPSSDGYVTTANAYWAFVPKITELFSNEQLAMLAENETAKWVFPSFGRQDTSRTNKALTDYIDSITKVWLNEDDMLDGWKFEGDERRYGGMSSSYIEAQPIEWLHLFYKWISETNKRMDKIKTKPVFLNQECKAVPAFIKSGNTEHASLFLPDDGTDGYETIYNELLANEETIEFVKKLGITRPSLKSEIFSKIIPQYEDGNVVNPKVNFMKFFQYYMEYPRVEVDVLLESIKECKFLLFRFIGDKTEYRAIARTQYFPNENLLNWFSSKPDTRFVLYNKYLELVGNENERYLVSFLTELGVKSAPAIIERELNWREAREIKPKWSYSSGYQKWIDRGIDGCKEILLSIDKDKSVLVWNQLISLVSNKSYLKKAMYGTYHYKYYSHYSEPFDSSEATRLRSIPWLLNSDEEFISASELTVNTLNHQYDISCDEAVELLQFLGIKKKPEEPKDEDLNISSYGDSLGLSEDEQRQAFAEFAKRKKDAESHDFTGDDGNNDLTDDTESDATTVSLSIKRVVKDIAKRATSDTKERPQSQTGDSDGSFADEDDYSKPTVDIRRKIEDVKKQAEQEIKEIARLEDLRQQAQDADKYSYAWFKALLELESINSGGNNANSREVSISFAKAEREEGTSRTIILKHPSRYIPQSMEDLADIPLELHFVNQPMIKIAIEVVSVKSYTLRAKLRTNAQIDGIDLSLVTEARIEAKNPVFLIEELRKAFIRLGDDEGYENNFDMQDSLCENIRFVFGPPGTGKTTYLTRDIILPMMREAADLKVLVLTPTNKSADVLVRCLMESMGGDHSYIKWLVRFGTTNDNTIEQSGVFRDKTFDIRTFPRNVTVTTIARFPYDYFLPDDSARLHLSALKWDYIIIDEASMIPLANIIYPLYKKTPEMFIIAGDPFQIEPITTVKEWKNENIYTMVELDSFTEPTTVPHKYHVELLTTQYRSLPEIGEVFSRFAYGGILRHYRSADSQRHLPINDFIELQALNIIKFPVSKFESIYRPKRLQGKTSYQIYSALFAFEFVKYISSLIELVKGDEKFRIGLIAPYRAQADLIDKLMTSVALSKNADVQVGTIHGFQGDECDIIIALFNPPPSITTHKDMFLNKLNIVNVSISRARDYLIVLMPDDNTDNVENLSLIKKVERLCKEQSTWNEQYSPAIEEAMFGSRTYLEDNSFSTSHQLVNVYGKPEKRYEVRSEDNAVDVQVHG